MANSRLKLLSNNAGRVPFTRSLSVILLTALTGLTRFSRADSTYDENFTSAKQAFEKRGESPEKTRECISLGEKALGTAENPEQKFDALVLQSRCYYFMGLLAKSDDEKKEIFLRGRYVGGLARDLLKDRAEGYYYYGINLARWAEANGILNSLAERHNLRRNIEAMLTRTAKDDGKLIPGKEYDSYGANRTLGIMYTRLPFFADGDAPRGLRYLREAVEKSVERNSLNVVYLAESLEKNDKNDEAKRVLDELLSFDVEGGPERYNPKRAAEFKIEVQAARKQRKELGR